MTVSDAVCVVVLVAEIVTEVVFDTVFVVTVKFAVVFPAVTVTELGTVATAVELLERLTTVPLVGAGPLRVTVPVDGVPPFAVVGFNVNETTLGTVTINGELLAMP